MNIPALLAHLTRIDVRISERDGALVVDAPPGILTAEDGRTPF